METVTSHFGIGWQIWSFDWGFSRFVILCNYLCISVFWIIFLLEFVVKFENLLKFYYRRDLVWVYVLCLYVFERVQNSLTIGTILLVRMQLYPQIVLMLLYRKDGIVFDVWE